jgi:hypothetical protein
LLANPLYLKDLRVFFYIYNDMLVNILKISESTIAALMAAFKKNAGLSKRASVTFQINGSDKVAEPMSVYDISIDLYDFARSLSDQIKPINYDQISPDGLKNIDEQLGTINLSPSGDIWS